MRINAPAEKSETTQWYSYSSNQQTADTQQMVPPGAAHIHHHNHPPRGAQLVIHVPSR